MTVKIQKYVYQTNKKSGVIYVYENHPYWVAEIGQSRAKRKCVGILDEKTGDVVPTRGRKPKEDKKDSSSAEDGEQSVRCFYGATYLLDAIGNKLGVVGDLKLCFPDTYKQILSIVYYLILEDRNPLYRFEKWAFLHKHPYGEDISSQRSSELFASISEDAKERFFRLQGKRRIEKEFWVYDTTTISSYSEALRQAQYGYNKENDLLPQLKLALVYGEKSGLPFYYRKLAGNIPDTKTIRQLLDDFAAFGFDKVKLVMDRGFYREDNINDLYREHLKFLVAAKTSLSFIRKEVDAAYDDMRLFANYDQSHRLYAHTISTEWNYSQARPYKGDVIKEKRRIYVHLYYNIDKAAYDERSLDHHLSTLREELLSGKRIEEHEKQYAKYFTIKATPKRGTQVMAKENVIKEVKRYYGYFALLTNETMDAITALDLYRGKDIIEKAFGNLKERLDMRRALVSSEKSLDGKLFVEFVALIFLSYIHKQMQLKKMYKDYTMQEVLDKLDVIECFERPGRKLRVGEVLEKQRQLYLDLDICPPSSLQ
jgi:transposase